MPSLQVGLVKCGIFSKIERTLFQWLAWSDLVHSGGVSIIPLMRADGETGAEKKTTHLNFLTSCRFLIVLLMILTRHQAPYLVWLHTLESTAGRE